MQKRPVEETYICEKRPTYVNRDLLMRKPDAKPGCMQKDLYTLKELSKETSNSKRRPVEEIYICKNNLYMWKETYICGKRPTDLDV